MTSTTTTGITGGLNTTLPTAMVISAFTAIALVNSLELQVRIWMTFKKRVGLYFWSLNVASLGVAVYALAFVFKFFKVIQNDIISCVLITIGWWTMVTGQSLVLYSRLHLLVVDRKKLRWILYMICIDAVIFHLPTTVLTFGVRIRKARLCVSETNFPAVKLCHARQVRAHLQDL